MTKKLFTEEGATVGAEKVTGGSPWKRTEKDILSYKAVNSLTTIKGNRSEYRMWDKRLRNALKSIWGKEVDNFLDEISGIPDKNASSNEKLRKEVEAIEEKYLAAEKGDEIREGRWAIIIAKVEGTALDKAIEVDKSFQGDGTAAWYRMHKLVHKVVRRGNPREAEIFGSPPQPRRKRQKLPRRSKSGKPQCGS